MRSLVALVFVCAVVSCVGPSVSTGVLPPTPQVNIPLATHAQYADPPIYLETTAPKSFAEVVLFQQYPSSNCWPYQAPAVRNIFPDTAPVEWIPTSIQICAAGAMSASPLGYNAFDGCYIVIILMKLPAMVQGWDTLCTLTPYKDGYLFKYYSASRAHTAPPGPIQKGKAHGQ